MNLYRVEQDLNSDYDTYDSMIVCAKDEKAARLIHPNDDWEDENKNWNGVWVAKSKIDQVKVELIGKAAKGIEAGVVLSSFNAG